MWTAKLSLLFVTSLVGFGLSGCDTGSFGGVNPTLKPETKTNSADTSAAVSLGKEPEPTPSATADPAEIAQGTPAGDTAAPGATMPKDGEEVAVLDTNQGRIILKFFPKFAPNHVENFKKLSKKGFYDGTKFHRVIPGFMIQGGDPNTKTGRGRPGTGGPGYSVNAEFNALKHTRGILSMARSSDPNSAGSQFFIMVAKAESLDNAYTGFGQVVKGMDAVDKIVALPRNSEDMPTGPEAMLTKVSIVKWPVKD